MLNILKIQPMPFFEIDISKKTLFPITLFTLALVMMLFPEMVLAGTINGADSNDPTKVVGEGGVEFKGFYDFAYGAATGYLGRGIAIVGGIIGIGMGAATGKALPAVIGVFLALFAVLGASVINLIFTATI